jgi:hypothetical protein
MFDPARGTCPVCAKVGQSAGPTKPVGPGPGIAGGAAAPGGGATIPPTRPVAPPGGGGGPTRPIGATRPATPADRGANVTKAVWPKHLQMDPIVGWLVAYEGNSAGRDYRLRSGRMKIGRDPDMDVQIEDDHISRKNHAFVVYDETSHYFFLQPGDQRGLVYLTKKNEQPRLVLAAEQLTAYDSIQLGKTSLLFVPLCGPDLHQWRSAPKPVDDWVDQGRKTGSPDDDL